MDPAQNQDLLALAVTAATVGTLHTLMGPDHYVPFIAIARAKNWSLRRTAAVTAISGLGHVGSSVILGFLGIMLGIAVHHLTGFEALRGNIAGWLLLSFGVLYMLWGIERAVRGKRHCHLHVHRDGTVHSHDHNHAADHCHPHVEKEGKSITPWVLFAIFVFGPCEPLIPLVMYPAAKGNPMGVVTVTAIFSVCTVAMMLTCVLLGYAGVFRVRWPGAERYAHALAGFAIALCGLAIQFGL